MDYILVDNFNDIKKLDIKPNTRYLCLMECYDGKKMVWNPIIGVFFKKDDEITTYDNKGHGHAFKIPETGFYYINQLPGLEPACIQLNEVRYFAEITYPDTEPDSFLEIEN